MQLKVAAVLFFTACAGAIWGCAEPRSPISPTLLSLPVTGTPRDTRAAVTTSPVLRVDSDGDGYDDGEPPPEGVPAPGPSVPPPGPAPIPDGTIPPVQLTINIVSPAGPAGFAPNPLQAAVGNTIVFMNSDVILHEIVLDDGTPVGSLMPGQSSAPLTVTLPTTGYRCTLHPSMVGQVSTLPPVATDGMPVPGPDPGSMPAPSPDPYGDEYDDGYEDDYYYSR